MKKQFYVLLIALLLILAGQAGASFWFQVKEITPIEMTANSEANFSVSVKGLGSERAYVELVFKNISDGFHISCPKMIKNVFPAGVTQFNCSVKAADVPPGNYSFVADVAAKGAPSGKKTGFINVLEKDGGQEIQAQDRSMATDTTLQGDNASQDERRSSEEPPAQSRNTPASGTVAAILAMMLVFRKMA
ncbi:MAG: hypothetical protein A4E49_02279 [Methanosaeta sp. PtaU1.Bin112]|nr:MAG: hypothetical protein A4E49_02279 [Methanosaeta sp. PtaU1.Bin112]